MFNNKPDNEADFCESYKSEILNSTSEEKDSSFSKLLTIVLLLAIVIGLSIIGYKFFSTKTNHQEPNQESNFQLPTSIQVSDDDLKVTLETAEDVVKEELQPVIPTTKATSNVVPIVKIEKETVIIEPAQLKESIEPKISIELTEEPKKVEVITADISTIVEQAEVNTMKSMQEIPTMKEVKREEEVISTKVTISSPAEVVTMHEVISNDKKMKEVETTQEKVTYISNSKPTPVVNQVNSSIIDQIANSIKLSIAAKEQKSFSKDEDTSSPSKTTNIVKEKTSPIENKTVNVSKEEKNLEIPLSIAPEAQYLEELADLSKQLENEKN